MPKERVRGFNYGRKSRYPKTLPRPYIKTHCYQPADGNIEDNDVITINVKANKGELIRFSNNPLILSFSVKVEKPGEGANQATEDVLLDLRKFKGYNPLCYMNPLLGPRTFFDKIEVLIDGQNVCPPKCGNFGQFYQLMNRFFTSVETREELLGDSMETRISDSAKLLYWNNAKQDQISPELRKLFHDLSQDETFRPYITMSMNFDEAAFPLAQQNLSLRNMYGDKYHRPNGFLPEASEITLRLHKRDNLQQAVEHAEKSDIYFSNNNGTVFKDLEVSLVSAGIVYESMQFSEIKDSYLGSRKYLIDMPEFRITPLLSNVAYINETFEIPARSKLAYACFIHKNQQWPDIDKKKTFSSRLVFPKNLESVAVSFNGVEGFVFKPKLELKDRKLITNQPSLITYFKDLKSRKLLDKSFGDFIPANLGENVGFEEALLIDLANVDTNKKVPSTMNMTLKFDDLSPANTYILVYFITQQVVEYKGKKMWECHEN